MESVHVSSDGVSEQVERLKDGDLFTWVNTFMAVDEWQPIRGFDSS